MLEFSCVSFLRMRWQTLPGLRMLSKLRVVGWDQHSTVRSPRHLCRCPGDELSTLCTKAGQTDLLTLLSPVKCCCLQDLYITAAGRTMW